MAILKIKDNGVWEEVEAIKGTDGHTPVKGVDYFTPSDIADLNIPTKTSDLTNDSGFTVAQVYKGSNTPSNDVLIWIDTSGGAPLNS